MMYLCLTFIYMYLICMDNYMTANIPLVTGNKLNCFISAKEMLASILQCAHVLLYFC